jgi:CRP-like cAMP-binding protein
MSTLREAAIAVTYERACAILDQHGWLSTQPPATRETILAIGRIRTYAPGQSIYVAGETATAVFALVEGGVDIVFPVEEGPPALIHRADPGFWVGDLATLSRRERLVSLRANAPSTMFVLPGRDLTQLLERQPEFYRVFYDLMHENMRLTFTFMADLLGFTAVERVARRLANISRRRGNGGDPWIDLPQNTLAAMLGISPATAHRSTRRLVELGLIQTGYGKIRVVDVDALAHYREHPEDVA